MNVEKIFYLAHELLHSNNINILKLWFTKKKKNIRKYFLLCLCKIYKIVMKFYKYKLHIENMPDYIHFCFLLKIFKFFVTSLLKWFIVTCEVAILIWNKFYVGIISSFLKTPWIHYHSPEKFPSQNNCKDPCGIRINKDWQFKTKGWSVCPTLERNTVKTFTGLNTLFP